MSEGRSKGNRFAALSDLADSSDSSDSSDSELEHVEEVVEQNGHVEPKGFRTWSTTYMKRTPRFSKTKHDMKDLHFLPDEPLRMSVQEGIPPILTNATVYPSLLERGVKQEERAESGTERGSAMAWAEKVKQSLEKAEAARKPAAPYQPSEDFIASLGKLSFFRRGNGVVNETVTQI